MGPVYIFQLSNTGLSPRLDGFPGCETYPKDAVLFPPTPLYSSGAVRYLMNVPGKAGQDVLLVSSEACVLLDGQDLTPRWTLEAAQVLRYRAFVPELYSCYRLCGRCTCYPSSHPSRSNWLVKGLRRWAGGAV